MLITYLFNSGFYINTGKNSFIIDYYKDSEDIAKKAVKNDLNNLYVLASHFHGDHFNPEIFKWKKERDNIRFILSKDILDENKAGEDAGSFIAKSDVYSDSNILIKAYGSTDAGISFYIEADGYKIFHAGDLNNWHWKEEEPENSAEYEAFFHRELEEIKKDNLELDIIFFPTDPRLGAEYLKGPSEFVKSVPAKLFVPMHFGDNFEKANAFKPEALKHCEDFFTINKRGDSLKWK